MPRKAAAAVASGDPAPASGEVLENRQAEGSSGTALVASPATRRGEVVRGKQEVKKHVAAIHTSGELGLVERKLVNILLLNAFDTLATARQHRLPTKMLMAMLGWSEGDDTVHLKKALLRIVTTPVEFNLMEENEPAKKPRWTATALLASADLVNGFCEYEYSTRLAEELADPDVYAIINVGIQRQFNSGYALTLYENCLRFRRTGSTGWMTLEVFRKLMGATAPTYDDFRRLSELVIKKAVVEVNALSDIKIKEEYERKGRKVTRIRFSVEEKAQQSVFSENERMIDEAKESDTYKRLRDLGIGEKLAVAWVLTDEQRAKSALDITEQRARGGQIKASPAGYVRRLMDDATIDLSGSAFEKKLKDGAAAQRAAAEAATAAKQKSEAESLARGDKIRDLVNALTDIEVKAYAAEYIAGEGAGKATTYNADTGTFKNAMERVPFTTWLRKQIAEKHGLAVDRDAFKPV
ncbi:replication initiation protein [Massilia orientalis]|uniref:Replication initiation protein n=1 Tax=Massilia orientalis TaxID=3050128 RepID=A0ACC7MDR9_9BURK|nr:replication initiation protein [Massilia sp. YIM B02787]